MRGSGIAQRVLSVIGAYKAYEKWLWLQVKNGIKPEHIAIILDGNRRWANGKEPNPLLIKDKWGHGDGAETVEQLLDWCERSASNPLRSTRFPPRISPTLRGITADHADCRGEIPQTPNR